ncbi:MAG: GNAT family N-acetyltransferase [Caulobacteraceae bacterium]
MRLPTADQHPFSSRAYAEAFAPLEPVAVEAWRVHLLERPLPGAEGHDLAGPYPMTNLGGLSAAQLGAGRREMADRGAVSLALVLDPWNAPDAQALSAAFDVVRPFKTHLAYDRAVGPINYTRRHWREVRQARSALVFRTVDPEGHVDTMARLYRNLVEAKHISGAAVLERPFFEALVRVPGLRLVLAYLDEDIVGSMTFIVAGDVCYAHLAGVTEAGRRHCAHYGCYAEALESYTDCQVIHLGGGPGAADDPNDPILYVKRKFANVELHSLLCGAVLDPDRYRALSDRRPPSGFFPAYRG